MKNQLFQLCFLLIINQIYGDRYNHIDRSNDFNSDEWFNNEIFKISNFGNRLVKAETTNETFSYDRYSPNGPSNWGKFSTFCLGSHQSPINLKHGNAIHQNGRIKFTGMSRLPQQVTYSNEGHTIRLTFIWGIDGPPTLTGGPLGKNIYKFEQLHFHFGNRNAYGSEHRLSGRAYPMEIHFVFSNTKYPNVSEAIKNTDGLAVVGRFYEITNENNPQYKIMNYINSVTRSSTTFNVTAPNTFSLESIMKTTSWSFYTYKGSLTTPNCNEVVTWIVSTEPIPLTIQDMSKFRTLLGHDGPMFNNFRPLQPVNDRYIYYYR